MSICSVDGCEKSSFCRGFCSKHYRTMFNNGTINRCRSERGLREKHKLAYNSYISMISRCCVKTNPSYKRYGGSGVKVCKEWLSPAGFQAFLKDMGDRGANESLDRIDSSKGYSKQNCRWSDISVQNRNRKSNIYYTYKGETMVLSDWAKKYNLRDGTVYQRYHRVERGEALFRPSQKNPPL